MRISVLIAALALLSFGCLAFAQPYSDITFTYVPYFGGNVPLTGDACWTGTPWADGTATVHIMVVGDPDYEAGQFPINGEAQYAGPGHFYGLTYALQVPEGSMVYCVVEDGSPTYTSDEFGPTPGGAGSQMYYITCDPDPDPCEWICQHGTDICDTREPLEEGFDGPHDILNGDTLSFIDTCTVRITALDGDAHGVSVEVFNGVPEYHPVAYDYMSRIVAVYWDGSAGDGTSLLVRMYYSQDEFDESGFSGVSCLLASRINEFAASWAPLAVHDKSPKYVEFTTDRSGYYTFDCHGTTPRRIPLNSDPTITAGDNELILCWQTMEEFETYRFHILRAEGPEGPFTEVATVPSQLPDIMTTASYNYEYRDGGLENGHVYYYKLSREDLHGNQDDYPGIFSGVPSLNGDAVEIEDYCLHPAYPNPFNPETRIAYDVFKAGHVDLRVFDILGREVALLVDDMKLKGRHNIVFNAKNLPSGLYFYRIDIGGQFTSTQKILLIK